MVETTNFCVNNCIGYFISDKKDLCVEECP